MKNWVKEIENLEGWTFGDNPQMADELAEQTASGKNLANCFLFSNEYQQIKVGDRSYVKNSLGNPICVIEVTEVTIVPFEKVDESFAKAEGYATLKEWQSIHNEFFRRIHPKFNNKTVVVCQRFKLLHVF